MPAIKTTLSQAVSRFRDLALSIEEGSLLGSETSLVSSLGISRVTLRQAARLLEAEGLLLVKRGISGGYYAARPSADSVATVVSAHLETLEVHGPDVTAVATALWIEVIGRAAEISGGKGRDTLAAILRKINKITVTAPFSEIRSLEKQIQNIVFDIVGTPYIRLIFQINGVFSTRRIPPLAALDGSDEHKAFVEQWRKHNQREIEAILDGDIQLAILSARRKRQVWHERIWALPGSA